MIIVKVVILVILLIFGEVFCHSYYKNNKFMKPRLIDHFVYGIYSAASTIMCGLSRLTEDAYKLATLCAIWSIVLFYMNYQTFKSSKLDDLDKRELVTYYIVSVCGTLVICHVTNMI